MGESVYYNIVAIVCMVQPKAHEQSNAVQCFTCLVRELTNMKQPDDIDRKKYCTCPSAKPCAVGTAKAAAC